MCNTRLSSRLVSQCCEISKVAPWPGPEDRVDFSEHKLQGKLNQTRVVARICARYLSESVRTSRDEISARESKLWMVEQVEEFSPEFEAEPLGNRRPLEDGEVKVVDAIRPQLVIDTALSSITPLRWRRKAGRVKPTCKRAVARFIATGYNAGTYVTHAEAGILQGSRGTSP